MTTITIDRALLEQALNALLLPCDRWNKQQFLIVKGAIESLNAALAALATTPKQPRPFVPWSKEAEMLESWAAQPATAPAQPDELEQLRKDAERYRWCVDNNLVLAGGTREFGWQIAPVGSEWNRFIDAAMKGTP